MYGQDTLAQAEAKAFAEMWGWNVRTADSNGALKATRNGHEVLLPPTPPRYSAELSKQIMQALNPVPIAGRGPPDSGEYHALMQGYQNAGYPVVGIGRRWGPRQPQIEEPTSSAPVLELLDADMFAWMRQRYAWAQPWYPRTITAANRDQTHQRAATWKPKTDRGKTATKWRPTTNLAACMSASSARHLSVQGQSEIGELLGVRASRTIRKAVLIGDRLWGALGAWPWAAFPTSSPPPEWWELDEPWIALYAYIEARVRTGGAVLRHIGG